MGRLRWSFLTEKFELTRVVVTADTYAIEGTVKGKAAAIELNRVEANQLLTDLGTALGRLQATK